MLLEGARSRRNAPGISLSWPRGEVEARPQCIMSLYSTQAQHCLYNCEDHSSFDFISAVLIYDLFHINLSLSFFDCNSLIFIKVPVTSCFHSPITAVKNTSPTTGETASCSVETGVQR